MAKDRRDQGFLVSNGNKIEIGVVWSKTAASARYNPIAYCFSVYVRPDVICAYPRTIQ